ncbi:hypothetical protein B0J14DRAFT_607393 [Halenospora varia]|nr:hypothetical protein B0J14DRAFT_607393 [Halenospora varia]
MKALRAFVSLNSSFVSSYSGSVGTKYRVNAVYLQSPPNARLRLFICPYPPGLACSINCVCIFLLPPAGFLCGCVCSCLSTSVVVRNMNPGQTPCSPMLHSVQLVGLLGMRAPARGLANIVVCRRGTNPSGATGDQSVCSVYSVASIVACLVSGA